MSSAHNTASPHRSLTLKQRARALRHHPTSSEALLWSLIRRKQLLGVQFRRQVVVGDFIVDFMASSRRVIVEIDGGYHERRVALDAKRQRKLEQGGYRVVRLSDELVLKQPWVAVGRIVEALEEG